MPDSSLVATPIGSPYPGLRPFHAEEAGIFFGREEQVDHMLTRLETHRFMAVVGTSGCGKSSLVRAGLIPALEQGLLCGAYPNWRIAVMRPGDDPFECLATALLASKALRERGNDPRAAAFLEATLRRGPLGLWEAIQETHLPAQTNVLLVVDQFEEIFRYRQQAANINDADAFVNLLVASARPPAGYKIQQNPPLFIVITMRSDFIGDCALFIGLPELISETDFLTPRMTRAQYQDAIVDPVRVFGWDLEPALVNRLLNDLGDTPDQLPVLQHALMRMWMRANAAPRGEKRLMLADYQAVGGLAEALSRHADEALQELTPPQQALAQILFRCLSERSASKRDTRRPVKLERVRAVAGVDFGTLLPVVETFRRPDRSFIMPPAPMPLTAETVLDISHESLISHWSLLNEWADKEARSAAMYLRLDDAARRFKVGEGDLLSDMNLKAALEWRQKEQPNPDWAARYGGDFKQAMNFLDDSFKTERYKRRVRYVLSPIGIGVLTLLSVLSLYAWRQRDAAQVERDRAQDAAEQAEIQRSRARLNYLALESQDSRDTALDLSLLLALEAVRLGDDRKMGHTEHQRAEQALRWALAAAGSQPLSGHDAPVSRLAVSPDGRWLASVSWGDRSVRLWDLETNPPAQCRVLRGHRNGVTGAAFSPDGRWLATAGRDGVVGLWELNPDRPCNPANLESEPQNRLVPTPNTGEVFTAITFSSAENGRLLAVGSDKGVIRLWDMSNLMAEPQLLEKHKDDIMALEFSPDGRLLASASRDKTVNIWDVTVPGNSVAATWHRGFAEHSNRVMALAFSPDGHWLASADESGVIYRWDPTNVSVQSIPFKGHEDTVTNLAFSPDGYTLISASRDGTIRLWDTAAEPRPAPQPKPRIFLRQDLLSAMALAKNDPRLFSASRKERIIRIWELDRSTTLEPLQLWDHERSVVALAFIPTPEGLHLVSADREGSTRIWNLISPFPIGFGGAESQDQEAGAESQGGASGRADKAFGVPTVSPAISPDGRTLAIADVNRDKDYSVRLRNLTDPTTQSRLLTGQAPVTALAFSPDGHTLAFADESGQVLLWDLNNPSAGPRRFTEHGAAVTAVAFSLDGHTLASAGRDNTMHLWNRDNGKEIRTLKGDEGIIKAIAFSPNGKTLASGSADNTVRLWDLDHPEVDARVLRGHQGPVLSLAFSPDGRLLASGAADRAVFIWHTQLEELSKLACRSVQRNLLDKEWEKYFKDEKYHETCPRDRP